jgi:hypothetical protein
MKIVLSRHAVPIRLTEGRLLHVTRRHPEMQGQEEKILQTVSDPDIIQEGDAGCRIALRHYATSPLTEKFRAVIYRETSEADGFVITAYFRFRYANGRSILWKR